MLITYVTFSSSVTVIVIILPSFRSRFPLINTLLSSMLYPLIIIVSRNNSIVMGIGIEV